MSDENGKDAVLDPGKLPGFGPDWRCEVTGTWHSGRGEIARPIYKSLDTERDVTSVFLAWTSDWLQDDGAGCILNRGLHFGQPEALAAYGAPLPLPPHTGIGLALIVGPETNYWEPSTLEQRALARIWARLMKRLFSPHHYELCFIPSLIRGHGNGAARPHPRAWP